MQQQLILDSRINRTCYQPLNKKEFRVFVLIRSCSLMTQTHSSSCHSKQLEYTTHLYLDIKISRGGQPGAVNVDLQKVLPFVSGQLHFLIINSSKNIQVLQLVDTEKRASFYSLCLEDATASHFFLFNFFVIVEIFLICNYNCVVCIQHADFNFGVFYIQHVNAFLTKLSQ